MEKMKRLKVKVGFEDLYKVINYLYKDEFKHYQCIIEDIEDRGDPSDECLDHIIHSVIALMKDANIAPANFGEN